MTDEDSRSDGVSTAKLTAFVLGIPLAAKIIVRGNPRPQPQPDPAEYRTLANEITTVWQGPQLAETMIEGQPGE
jgi:hypothetical protein